MSYFLCGIYPSYRSTMLDNGLSATITLGRTATKETGAPTMENLAAQPSLDPSPRATEEDPSTDHPTLAAHHPILSRLMEEVRNTDNAKASYDRVHNRHNRGGR